MRYGPLDLLQHILEPVVHVIVPEPQHSKSAPREVCVAIGIALVAVLATIHLDDQSLAQAGEVHDPGADRHLATKGVSLDVAAAQMEPERQFLGRLVGT